MTLLASCPCGSKLAFVECCEPIITGMQTAASPEQLMRSRYSAYTKADYGYIYRTYCDSSRVNLSPNSIAESASSTLWLNLDVIESQTQDNTAEVEFKAYYKESGSLYCMHERSRFEKHNNAWFYVNGDMLKGSGICKLGRNEMCICGSGKKFKRCCQSNKAF